MGTLVINRNKGQRVRLGGEEGVDAAELVRQLSTSGIWLDVSWSDSRRQFRLNINAPAAVQVLREELLAVDAPAS
ncbi:hypothetical protein [Stutzerimonas chloritidismutans]|uniref:hypothetical protein n=1 Tax=Stutzerimonas chloritidismutans TaxID=203192 RepID=UPI0028AA14A0|nr:hypothetical protein [Stutzerimonas chloritidismutans]